MATKSRIVEIFEFMRTCPQLQNLFSIGGKEEIGNNIILPQGSSQAYRINERNDVLDGYEADIQPLPSVYEDYQINCFQIYDGNDKTQPNGNMNVLSYEECAKVCDWVQAQDESGNLPTITNENVINIECLPFVPQIRYLDPQKNIICYFITVRIRYVNRRKGRYVYYDND